MSAVDLPRQGSRFISATDRPSPGAPLTLNVPTSIPRRQVLDFIESLGIDLRDIPSGEGATAFVIGWDVMRCTVYAKDTDGHYYLDETGEAAAVHHISIRLTDE